MPRRSMKGGDDDFIGTMVASGVGAYAAKNATSMGDLLWTLAKYSLVIILIMVTIYLVLRLLGLSKKENFIPVAPSSGGDKKEVTPAGNVILY